LGFINNKRRINNENKTDIVNTNSKIIAMGNLKGLVEKAFNKKLDADDSMFLEGVMSRKKQIAPPLLANLD